MSKLSRLWLSLHGRMDRARPSAKTSVVLGLLTAAGCGAAAFADQFPWLDFGEKPIVLKQMGSFMARRHRGDHARRLYPHEFNTRRPDA